MKIKKTLVISTLQYFQSNRISIVSFATEVKLL